MPVEVIAALCSVGGVIAAKGIEVGWRKWRHLSDSHSDDLSQMADVLTKGIEDGGQVRTQVFQWLQEERARAEQCRVEQEALRVELDAIRRALQEEQRRTAKLERRLAERDKEIAELRQTLVADYARKPSTPVPPPADDSSEDETPRHGKRSMNGE